ncbi:alkyl hydroperoxide reductase [Oceanobacillus zhaokaii]|uniref:Alkyl hydroperoxide reductase n=1 Tax=Oceanobacillus zhaokaii TaxID=2052660 RepID=A0A345PJA0_9BACI|nr:redoxin domain-containing protein [Oceanobacillus zhaokaii]AXI10080.1 alkyl hydroperoxide reductase [Oceanobacillus zhaokaii]
MKRAIIIIVLVGMFGWAIYDLVSQSKSNDISNLSGDERIENNVGLSIGNFAPNFRLQTLKGESVQLSDYHGSRVILNFWNTWCEPCRTEMPDLEKFYQDKDVVVLAVNLVNTEPSKQKIRDFVKDLDLQFPVLLDEGNDVGLIYEIHQIPTSFMIDSNGIIQYKALGVLNYELIDQEFEKMD